MDGFRWDIRWILEGFFFVCFPTQIMFFPFYAVDTFPNRNNNVITYEPESSNPSSISVDFVVLASSLQPGKRLTRLTTCTKKGIIRRFFGQTADVEKNDCSRSMDTNFNYCTLVLSLESRTRRAVGFAQKTGIVVDQNRITTKTRNVAQNENANTWHAGSQNLWKSDE